MGVNQRCICIQLQIDIGETDAAVDIETGVEPHVYPIRCLSLCLRN